jgi:flavin reductase (DIM6/NTAB) family NADH-FMN oxidoreductase RutF
MAERTAARAGQSLDRKDAIGAAIGRIPSGVFIITARRGETSGRSGSDTGPYVGMMASWIAQAGFEPPAVSVAIHPDREIYQAILDSGAFCINVISNENMNLMRAFSKYSPDQFKDLDLTDTPCGVTLNESVAVLQCRVTSRHDAGDHHLFIAEVIDGDYLDHEQSPMIHLRKSGFNY